MRGHHGISAGVVLVLCSLVAADWPQEQRLKASDGQYGDGLGGSVAVSGPYLAVGAAWEGYYVADNFGAVYMFEPGDSGWEEVVKIANPDPGQDRFGNAVSVSGRYAVFGAFLDDAGAENSGSAYVYERVSSGWTQVAHLTSPLPREDGYFGHSVCISGDLLIVGARDEYQSAPFGGNGQKRGAAYVYRLNGGDWVLDQKLVPPDPDAYDGFGSSVSISGGCAVVGSYKDDDAANDSGAVYVFDRSESGWENTAKLTASDGMGSELFGSSACLTGETLIVGAPTADRADTDSGMAYIFERGESGWTETARLEPTDAGRYDNFGRDVAVYGGQAIVGSPSHDGFATNAGAAYVYERSETGWSLAEKLKSDDLESYDSFGCAVAMDAETAVVGASSEGVGSGYEGAAYVFAVPAPPKPDLTRPGDAIVGTSGNYPGGDLPNGPLGPESPAEAIDDDPATKYLNLDKEGSGFVVAPSVGATMLTAIALTTANDSPERDPASVTIAGSNDGVHWVPITTALATSLPDDRFAEGEFVFTAETPGAYERYRVIFPTLKDGASANSMQIAEVRLVGQCAPLDPDAPLAEDRFAAYAAGHLPGKDTRGTGFAPGGTWSGDSADESSVSAGGGLVYPHLARSGGKVTTTGDGGSGTQASLNASPGGPLDRAGLVGSDGKVGGEGVEGTLYVSFLARSKTGQRGGAFAGLELRRDGQEVLGVGNNWNAHAYSTYGLAETDLDSANPEPGRSYQHVDADETHLFVLCVEYRAVGDDDVTVYLDPAVALSQAAQAEALKTLIGSGDASFDAISLRSGTAGNEWDFDEIRFGTTWRSVLPIPEPASLALLSAGVVAMLRRRRRRR